MTSWSPVSKPDIIINEIYYNSSDWRNGFVELYIWNDRGENDIDLSGYRITTFDGDEVVLPDVVGLDNYDYIAIYFGSGVSDLDASDGSATIFLNLNASPLDDRDEVGLIAPDYETVDFVRYAGGDGGKARAGWKESDAGISQNSADESIQLFGYDFDSSENWASSPPTPAKPNVYRTSIGGAGKAIPVYFQNGLEKDINITQAEINSGEVLLIDDLSRGLSTVFTRGSGVNLSEINILRNLLNNSYSYYRNLGLNEPATRSDGSILIRVTKNNRFAAEAHSNGSIDIDIGGNLSNSSIAAFMQWNIAHEFFHLLEFERINFDGTSNSSGVYLRDPVVYNAPEKYAFVDEGAAEYWGLATSIKNYNYSEQKEFDISVNVEKQYPTTFKSIDYNYSKIFTTLDINVPSLGTGTSNVYYYGYLFSKYIASKFSKDKLKDIS